MHHCTPTSLPLNRRLKPAYPWRCHDKIPQQLTGRVIETALLGHCQVPAEARVAVLLGLVIEVVALIPQVTPVEDDSRSVGRRAIADHGGGDGEAGDAVGGGEVVPALEQTVDGVGDTGACGGGKVGGVELGPEIGLGGVEVGEEGDGA